MKCNGKSALFVLPTGVLGGAERVMYNLASYILSEGGAVTIYIMSRGRQAGWEEVEKLEQCEVIFGNSSSEKTSLLATAFAVGRLSRSNKYDYVFSTHTHINGFLSALRKVKVLRCRYLVSRESTFIFERFFGVKRWVFYMIYRFLYGKQDLLVCQTDRMKSSLLDSLSFLPSSKVVCLNNPVNMANIRRMVEEEHENICVQKPCKTIVACGRLIPLKGYDNLIRAFSLVASHYNVTLVILGAGEQRSDLEALACSLNLSERVCFAGKVINPFPWFKMADLGVISSHKEGFPNTVLEMMASGTKFVIATPCTDGVNELPGVQVLSGFEEGEMAGAICSALSSDNDNSEMYKAYVDEYRDVSVFWSKLNFLLTGR